MESSLRKIIYFYYSTSKEPAKDYSAVADSGCTTHLLKSNGPLINKLTTSNWLCVGIPNGATITEYHNANMNISHLKLSFLEAAIQAMVHPDLNFKPLLSLGKLCNNCCDYVLLD